MDRTSEDTFPDQSEQSEPPVRRIPLRLIIATLCIVILAIAIIPRVPAPDSPAIQAQLQAIREAGHPITIDELETWYESPTEDEDAIPVLREVMPQIVLTSGKTWIELLGLNSWDIPDPADYARSVRYNGELVEWLNNERPFRNRRYPRFREFGMEFSPEEHRLLKYKYRCCDTPVEEIAGILLMDAIHHAFTGDPDRATQSLVTTIDALELLRGEPVVNEQTFRKMRYGDIQEVFELILQSGQPGEDVLARLDDTLSRVDIAGPLANALIAERCLAIRGFKYEIPFVAKLALAFFQLNRGPSKDDQKYRVHERDARSRRLEGKTEDMELMLMQSAAAVDFVSLPLQEQAQRNFEKESREFRRILDNDFENNYIVSKGFRFQFEGVPGWAIREEAALRTMRLAIAIERYEVRHGSRPDALPDLAEEYPDISGTVFLPIESYEYTNHESGYELTADNAHFHAAPEN